MFSLGIIIDVDATTELLLLAQEKATHVEVVSLGQGQGEKAASSVWAAAKHGYWAFLQNCHLASSWMPKLESLIKE